MAILHVKAGSSNTAPYETWAKAATSMGTAVSAAGANDFIYVDSTFSETGLSSTTYAPAVGVQIISTNDTTNNTPTTYLAGASVATTTTGAWIVNSGEWFGITFKAGSGSSSSSISLGNLDNSSPSFEDCTFQHVTTSANGVVNIGVASTTVSNVFVHTKNCSFIWVATGQGFLLRGNWQDEGSNLDAGATHPAALIKTISFPSDITLNGSDLSANTGTYFPAGGGNYVARLVECKLGVGATIQAALTVDGSGEVWIYDCDSADNHYKFQHICYRGSTLAGVATYLTAGATYDGSTHFSLTITAANATFGSPYYSPWIDVYNAGTSAVTPYFEVNRSVSATAYTDGQVWAEFMVKTTSGSTRTTLSTDRRGPLAAAVNQAAGIGNSAWTGLGGSSWSGKCDSGSSVTPAAIGYIRGRIVMATNDNIVVDPRIYGLGVANLFERVTPTGFINDTALVGSSYAPPIVLQAGRRGALY